MSSNGDCDNVGARGAAHPAAGEVEGAAAEGSLRVPCGAATAAAGAAEVHERAAPPSHGPEGDVHDGPALPPAGLSLPLPPRPLPARPHPDHPGVTTDRGCVTRKQLQNGSGEDGVGLDRRPFRRISPVSLAVAVTRITRCRNGQTGKESGERKRYLQNAARRGEIHLCAPATPTRLMKIGRMEGTASEYVFRSDNFDGLIS